MNVTNQNQSLVKSELRYYLLGWWYVSSHAKIPNAIKMDPHHQMIIPLKRFDEMFYKVYKKMFILCIDYINHSGFSYVITNVPSIWKICTCLSLWREHICLQHALYAKSYSSWNVTVAFIISTFDKNSHNQVTVPPKCNTLILCTTTAHTNKSYKTFM